MAASITPKWTAVALHCQNAKINFTVSFTRKFINSEQLHIPSLFEDAVLCDGAGVTRKELIFVCHDELEDNKNSWRVENYFFGKS